MFPCNSNKKPRRNKWCNFMSLGKLSGNSPDGYDQSINHDININLIITTSIIKSSQLLSCDRRQFCRFSNMFLHVKADGMVERMLPFAL